jgi:hypothetical protein
MNCDCSRNYIELPVKDPNGCHIMFHSFKENEPSKYCFSDAARVYFMMIDKCIQLSGTSSGIIFVFDAVGFKFGHILRLNLSLIHKIIVYVQVIFFLRQIYLSNIYEYRRLQILY